MKINFEYDYTEKNFTLKAKMGTKSVWVDKRATEMLQLAPKSALFFVCVMCCYSGIDFVITQDRVNSGLTLPCIIVGPH
jgi:hypothetical protein